MGDGTLGQTRFHPDRRVTWRDQAIYWQNQYTQEKSRASWLEGKNQELALKVVALNKELARYAPLVEFKSGEKVGNGISRRA